MVALHKVPKSHTNHQKSVKNAVCQHIKMRRYGISIRFLSPKHSTKKGITSFRCKAVDMFVFQNFYRASCSISCLETSFYVIYEAITVKPIEFSCHTTTKL